MQDAPQITPQSWLMVATLGLVWGSTFMVIELALAGFTPVWLASGRIVFAALLMLPYWLIRGGKLWSTDGPRPWMLLTMIGITSSALPFVLISWGQQYVTSGFTGVSMAAVALIVLPLAHFLVPGERMTLRRTAGFLIGFVGVCVLIGGQAFGSSGAALENWGRLACLGAGSCYAVSSIYLRQLPPVDPIGLATVLLLIGAVVVLPLALLVDGMPAMPDRMSMFWLVLLGLVPTAGANFLRVLVVRTAGPVFMSLTNYQVPIWAVVMGAIFLSEPLPPSLLLALLLILGGVALSQWGALTRLFGRV